MKVYRIKLDTKFYQRFIPVDEVIWSRDALNMDCQNKKEDWPRVDVYVFNPKRERADISYLGPGGFLLNQRACDALRTPLEMAAEVLPVYHEDEILYLVNVLECVNCLDRDKTEFPTGADGKPMYYSPKDYIFHRNRFSQCSLMKIPETSRGEVLCLTDVVDFEDDFKAIVEQLNLTGVRFEEIWRDV